LNVNANTTGVLYLGNTSTGGVNIAAGGGNITLPSGVWQSNGNVGIGTNAPGQNLQVGISSGSTASNGVIRVAATNGTTSNRAWDLGVSQTVSPYNFYIQDTGMASPALTVQYATGNVGIGTVSPTSLFSVGSSSQFQVNSSGALVAGSIASGFGTILTGNTITGTTINGTTGINTGAGAGTNRIDVNGNLVNIGTISSGAITSGLINGQTISSSANFTGSLNVVGTLTSGSLSSSSATITGGSINGTIIGATTPAAGTFTNLTTNNLAVTGTTTTSGITTLTETGYALNSSSAQWEDIGTLTIPLSPGPLGQVMTLHYHGGNGISAGSATQQANDEIQLRQNNNSCTQAGLNCLDGYFYEWGGGNSEITSVKVNQTSSSPYVYEVYADVNPNQELDNWSVDLSTGATPPTFVWKMALSSGAGITAGGDPSGLTGGYILVISKTYNLQDGTLVATGGQVGIGTASPSSLFSVGSSSQFQVTSSGNISLTAASPVLDATAGTLSINTVTNKPVTFGTGLVTANNFASSSVAITGGAINGTSIGVTTASTGTFTTANILTPTNSATAFQVQNSQGAPIFTVDTTTTNYLTNPGFEVNTTGWAIDGATSITRVTTNKYHGVGSLQIINPATANTGAKTTAFNTALASTTQYTLSFYAQLSSGTFTTLVAGHADNGSTKTACTLNSNTVVTAGWNRYSCTFTTGTVSGTPYIYIGQSDATARTFFIDAVQLQTGGNVTPYYIGAEQLRGVVNAPATFESLSNSTTAFQIQDSTGTQNLLVADTLDGRIGIGTTTPAVLLNVKGGLGGLPVTSGTTWTSTFRVQASSNSVMDFGNQNTGNYAGWIQMTDGTNGGATTYPLLLNPNGGNVGIGSTFPTTPLFVQTAATASTPTILTLSNPSTVGSGEAIALSDWDNNGLISAGGNPTNGYGGWLQFQTYNTSNVLNTGMMMLSNGNVGIGTTGALSKLDVNGGEAIGSYAGVNAAPSNGLIVSGNVGIGITTPIRPLTVSSEMAMIPSGYSTAYFNVSDSTGSNGSSQILDIRGLASNGSAEATLAQIRLNASSVQVPNGYFCVGNGSGCTGSYTNGRLYSIGAYVGSADYAESYISTNLNMQPGMLVTSDSQNPGDMVETTTTAYDTSLTGVISTDPGVLIGTTSTDNPPAGSKSYPIALTGRVPVLVTDENGPVEVGDYLTSSATMPGFAMKATHTGITIGQALAPFDGTTAGALTQVINGETFHTGTLTLFVHVAYENINNTYVIGSEDLTVAQQIAKGLAQGTVDTQSLTASNNADSFIIKQNPRSGTTGSSTGTSSMAAILQVQSGDLVRFMVAADGAATINAQPADPTENIFVVNNNGAATFAITATGNVIVSQTLIVKKDIASLGEVLGTSAIVARNISAVPLHQGDLVILKGAETQQIAGEQNPILSVVPSTAANPDTASAQTIVGVVDRDLSDFNIPGAPVSTSTSVTVVPPQEYLDIVTSGTYSKLNVDSSGGAIIAGDKLTVSANAGYARKMLPTEQGQMPLVGVALDSLASGNGQVRVYLMLNQAMVAAATAVGSSGSGSSAPVSGGSSATTTTTTTTTPATTDTTTTSGSSSTPTTTTNTSTTTSTSTDTTTATNDTTTPTTDTAADATTSTSDSTSTDSSSTVVSSASTDTAQSTISVTPSSSTQSDISVVAPTTTSDSSAGVAAQSSVVSGS